MPLMRHGQRRLGPGFGPWRTIHWLWGRWLDWARWPSAAGSAPGTASGSPVMQRKIKVLHLIDSLALGGAQTMLFACLPRFDAARYEFTLAALHAGPSAVFWGRARSL